MSKNPNKTLMGNIGHQYYTNTFPPPYCLSLPDLTKSSFGLAELKQQGSSR